MSAVKSMPLARAASMMFSVTDLARPQLGRPPVTLPMWDICTGTLAFSPISKASSRLSGKPLCLTWVE